MTADLVYGRRSVREALRGRREVLELWATERAVKSEDWLAEAKPKVKADRELVGVDVGIGSDERQNALVIPRLGAVGQLPVGLQPQPDLVQPVLGLDRPLGRPDLEHLPPAAQRLAHGPPPVDEVGGQFRTRS